MSQHILSRRSFFGTTAGAALAITAPTAAPAAAGAHTGNDFAFEVRRSDEEWRARLSKDEFIILRKGSTELPKSHPNWNENRDGTYACVGCDLHVYSANWKVLLDVGWAFFRHGEENAILLGVDGPVAAYGAMMGDDKGPGAMIEAHCRRCGSHLGHVVIVEGLLLHCINGTSLAFTPNQS